MNNLDDQALMALLQQGESEQVEFKASFSGSANKTIPEAICAFANDMAGTGKVGVVFVGVSDKEEIVGTQVTDQLLRTLADMKYNGRITPVPSMTVQKRNFAGKEVAVIQVQPSDSPPVRFEGNIHIRTGTRRARASLQDERILRERARAGHRYFDVSPIPIADVSDLNMLQFENEYLPRAVSPEILVANNRTRIEQLASTKMIVSVEEPMATVLGVLVLAKSPSDFMAGSYMQFLKINGRDLSDEVLDNADIHGTVSDVLREVDGKIRSHNRRAVDFTSGPVERSTSLFPLPALQQLLYNAVMHRTYENTNAPTRVTWFQDRIEILSPGGPFGVVSARNFGQPGVTDYRNPNLAEALKVLGFVQRFGVGITVARRQLEDAGHPSLKFNTDNDHVLVTVPGRTRSFDQ
jgi:ATP-dependent DNA helicase RecG